MKCLCRKCAQEEGNEFWNPCSIEKYGEIITRKISRYSKDYKYALYKNVCYNLQCLEMFTKILDECALTSVLSQQLYKLFVIISASIIEGIFYHELKKKNLISKQKGEKIKIFEGSKKISDKNTIFEINAYIKTGNERETELTFDQMLGIIEAQHIMGSDVELYKKANYLRKIRNKIHLHLARNSMDTDYNSVGKDQYEVARKTLFGVFKSYFSLSKNEIDETFCWLKE